MPAGPSSMLWLFCGSWSAPSGGINRNTVPSHGRCVCIRKAISRNPKDEGEGCLFGSLSTYSPVLPGLHSAIPIDLPILKAVWSKVEMMEINPKSSAFKRINGTSTYSEVYPFPTFSTCRGLPLRPCSPCASGSSLSCSYVTTPAHEVYSGATSEHPRLLGLETGKSRDEISPLALVVMIQFPKSYRFQASPSHPFPFNPVWTNQPAAVQRLFRRSTIALPSILYS